jgi:uncharacterized protein YodC (DUF2158 family)
MTDHFNAGDVVQLKSGGPKMTVTQTGKDSVGSFVVWCAWFVENKKVEDTFPPEALKPA